MKRFIPTKMSVIRFILITLLVHFLSNAFSQNSVTTHAGSSQGFNDSENGANDYADKNSLPFNILITK